MFLKFYNNIIGVAILDISTHRSKNNISDIYNKNLQFYLNFLIANEQSVWYY